MTNTTQPCRAQIVPMTCSSPSVLGLWWLSMSTITGIFVLAPVGSSLPAILFSRFLILQPRTFPEESIRDHAVSSLPKDAGSFDSDHECYHWRNCSGPPDPPILGGACVAHRAALWRHRLERFGRTH